MWFSWVISYGIHFGLVSHEEKQTANGPRVVRVVVNESSCTARSAACNAPKSEQCAHGNGASERTESEDAQGVRGPAGGPNEVRAGQRTDSGQWTVIELRYQCENGPQRGSLFSGLRQIALKGPVQVTVRGAKASQMQRMCMEDIGIVYSACKKGLSYLWYTHTRDSFDVSFDMKSLLRTLGFFGTCGVLG